MQVNSHCSQQQEIAFDHSQVLESERRTFIVVLLSLTTMLVEVVAGLITGSMALLADGYHMATHVGALFLTYFIYRLSRSPRVLAQLNFGPGKMLALGGFASAILLGLAALWMIYESTLRLFNPQVVKFQEALIVTLIGLGVNLISAKLLWKTHSHDHDHQHMGDHHDANIKGAFYHVLADAVTSVLALVALTVGMFGGGSWLDPLMGIVGALVILHWAGGLIRNSAFELIDAYPIGFKTQQLKILFQERGLEILDLHVWKNGPDTLICILTLKDTEIVDHQWVREQLREYAPKIHLTVQLVS